MQIDENGGYVRCLFCAMVIAISAGTRLALGAAPPSGAEILQDLKSFQQMATVLMVAAHPDDENTQLITYLARGRGYRMAYLSVTRGDGGQNVLGSEFGDELGVIRTQELLAARRLDSGRQFFTRAIDFGYSKDFQETLNTWDHQQMIGDVVRVMRTFRPDVVVTRFSTQPARGQHGQHTASAVLALEAFKVAGDPKAFPEQLAQLQPWQPKRIMMNGGGGGRGGPAPAGSNVVRIDVGGNDAITGESYGAIAGKSRSMHKSQGFGNFGGRGGGGGGPVMESFVLMDGAPVTNDIMDGIDTTWARVPGGADVARLTGDAIAKFDPQNPATSVPALLEIRAKAAPLPSDPVVDDRRKLLDRVIAECLGLGVETTIPQAEVVPGESMALTHSAIVRSAPVPVRWTGTRYPSSRGSSGQAVALAPNQEAKLQTAQKLPENTPLTQPYWLRQEHPPGIFVVEDPSMIGQPEDKPAFPVEFVFDVGGQTLVVPDEPVQVISEASKSEVRRRLDVISPVAIDFLSQTAIFAPGGQHPVTVQVIAYRPNLAGTLQLPAPAGWKVEPASQPFQLTNVGQSARLTFNVTAPPQAASASFSARAKIGAASFGIERQEIRYEHIPFILLQPPASLKAVALDLAIRGKMVGYLQGAGDSVAECLEQMGYEVTQLTVPDLNAEKLKTFDAVVIGVRAFDTHRDLGAQLPALFAYVESGGNVVMQYNRVDGMSSAPISLRISQERITDENATPTFLAADHPALNSPNKITPADFAGWVQERGIYFPNQWDERYTPILGFSDPGEQPLNGGLLVAHHGKGYFVYTGLAFFRELPAGVPGAYRLFANLVSLGK